MWYCIVFFTVLINYIVLYCTIAHNFDHLMFFFIGWINELLSWRGFIPVSRLTYCAYLIHPVVMIVMSFSAHNLTHYTDVIIVSPVVNYSYSPILYRWKIYTEFNLATWLRLVNFTELNISEFWFLNFNYISYHWDSLNNLIIRGIKI